MAENKDESAALAEFQGLMKSWAEREEREFQLQKEKEKADFFGAIPAEAGSLYLHLSHKISPQHPYLTEIRRKYGEENLLVTIAPERSGESSYDSSLDKIAYEEKRRTIIEPFENFSAKRKIDAVVYLGKYLCDGYQSSYFVEEVVTKWHLWHAVKSAELCQSPLVVGYQDGHCFGVECYEREEITDPTKMKIPCRIVKV